MITNAWRDLSNIFPNGFLQGTKHDHAKDFNWPSAVSFEMLHQMYRRNGLAKAAAKKTMLKVWEETPEFWQSEKPTESEWESMIAQRMRKIRGWSAMIEADERAFVGGYSGLIMRIADNKAFDQPVGRVSGGLDALVELIPAWAGQLRVSKWDDDTSSPTYGQPQMFLFNEAQVASPGIVEVQQARSFTIHPDRVIIWSQDGTVHARSDLEAGYNDLIDAEKIKGAGGEGFWKSSKGSLILELDKEAKISDMAKSMGVAEADVVEAVSDQVEDFQKGFDKSFLAQGMGVQALKIDLPQPKEFFDIPVQSFATSVTMPVRELIGNQTGERSSTEDSKTWAKSCMARRERIEVPSMEEFLARLQRFGIIPVGDWTIHWTSLLSASPEEGMNRAKNMAEINKSSADPLNPDAGETFSTDEIRAEAGFKPQSEVEGDDDE